MTTLQARSATSLGARTRQLSACETRLAVLVGGHTSCVSTPAAATLSAGGKRLRPLLVFCSTPDTGGEAVRDLTISAAVAVELVHMATLVHDDLLDGAVLRRGRPTIASANGPSAAIQVGDFLFARAFFELSRSGRPEAVATLARAALDLSRGELDQQRAAFDLALSEDAYLARCRRKTSALFSAACRLGAMIGGAGREAQDRLAAFGEHVGVAFQIFDDILDIVGSPGNTGKRRGTDLLGGTVTLPIILALQHEPELAHLVATAGNGTGVDTLCDRLEGHPGVAEARERALSFVRAARSALDGPLDGIDSAALLRLADGVVDRYA
ncbi:MAG: polyprenyl synthetase family protein [Actinobacteria bacterium]|nr:polyprenyl synthetase family protein [Actinomycetota bacterium]